MNHIYIGDHPCSPHESEFECPECGAEFETMADHCCPDCRHELGENEPVVSDWEDIQ